MTGYLAFAFFVTTALIAPSLSDNQLLVDKLRLDFMDLEEQLWKFVLVEVPNLDQLDGEYYVTKLFYEFTETLHQVPHDILRGTKPIRHIPAYLELYSDIKHTDKIFRKFQTYLLEQLKLHKSGFDEKLLDDSMDLNDIVRDIMDPENGANVTVHKIYNLTFGRENMMQEILDVLIDDYNCKGHNQSPKQIYYNLYNVIALNGLKSYVMLQFVYLFGRLTKEDVDNLTQLSENTKMNFERRVNETMTVFRGVMEVVSDEVIRCSPAEHVEGNTHEQITRLLQGHIQNEVDMNAAGTCRRTCGNYPISKSYGCYDSDSKYCQEMERCTGKLIDCRFVESHMDICPARQLSRRYNYIQYKSGTVFGQEQSCWTKPVKSWWRWFVHCSYCFCICDEQGPKSDRFISLRPVLSDIANNKVMTGMKFVKRNRIIHLQIQQGTLLQYGYIDNTTVEWVPVDTFQITDPGVYNKFDYHTLSYESRAMALDDVTVEQQNLVLTGVQFKFLYGKLRLQIHVSQFDWNTGKVQNESNFVYKPNGGRNKLNLDNLNLPTQIVNKESELNVDDPYIEFTHTGIRVDAAQTTIPFIDIQPVFNSPQVPLRGAGIYYRASRNAGGFIAPRIRSYKYDELLLVRFSNETRNVTLVDVAAN